MSRAGRRGTESRCVTDLAITGKPAQFGRGVMQDVSDKLLGQFVACLESRLAGGAPGLPASRLRLRPSCREHRRPSRPTRSSGRRRHRPPIRLRRHRPHRPATRPRAPPPPPPQKDDALNLGATVLPVLAKAYWKQALAGVVVVGVIIWLIGRG